MTGNKRSSSAIALTADGTVLLVVNPDSNSITLIDTAIPRAVREIPVGKDPRTATVDAAGRRAYVANRGSDTISVVDLLARQVIAEIPIGHHPYGVVVSPHGQHIYVAEQGSDRLNILNTATLESVQTIPLVDRPSGLAISADSRTLYVTHLLTSAITIVTVQPDKVFLPLIHRSTPELGTPFSSQEEPIFSVPLPMKTLPLWPDSNLVQSIVIAPDGKLAYVPHTRSNSSNRALTLDTTVFPLVSVVGLSTPRHLVGQQLNLDTIDPPAVGLPFDAAFTPDGNELWVLNAASNDITVIDVADRQRVAHIEVGDNPRGIVISPDGATAYVNNTLEGTVSIIDTATYTITAVITNTNIPLDPMLLTGKRLFHSSDDPRMGQDQWMSCNTCHFDGEHDGRTWFLGFAGPRNTPGLLGMGQTLPLRWSGEWDEAADSEFAIRMDSFGIGLIDGEMNCSLSPPDCVNHPPNAGRSADLDALAAYIDSLTMPLHPDYADGQPLSAAAQRGQALFHAPDIGCAACHPPPLYTDGLIHDVGTATPDEQIGPTFNTPSLRGLYDSAPYFHDGSAATLYDALTHPSAGSEHDVRTILNEGELQNLIDFLLVLPFQ